MYAVYIVYQTNYLGYLYVCSFIIQLYLLLYKNKINQGTGLLSHTVCTFCIAVAPSLVIDQRSKQSAQEFHVLARTQRDIIYYQEQGCNIHQSPPPKPQQSVVQRNQRQQQMNGNYKIMLPISGAQHTLDGPQSGRGGAKFGGCCAPRGGAQHKSGEIKFPPVNQPERNAFSLVQVQISKGFITTSNSTITQYSSYR